MTTQGAGFVKGVKDANGNYRPAGSGRNAGSQVAELSSHEQIQEAGIDNPDEELVIEELGENPRIRERREDERFIKVNLDSIASDRLEKFFEPETIEELERKSETIEGESKPKDIDEVWENIREGVRKHNKEVAKNKKRKSKERIREAYRDPALDKKMKNMTGEQMQRVMNSDENSSTVDEEELQEALESVEERYSSFLEESEPEINDPSNEIEELEEGTEAWREIGGYWEELANDVEASSELPNTEITTLSDGETKIVKTSYPDLCEELKQVDENPNKDGEIVEENGDVITARVSEGDKF